MTDFVLVPTGLADTIGGKYYFPALKIRVESLSGESRWHVSRLNETKHIDLAHAVARARAILENAYPEYKVAP